MKRSLRVHSLRQVMGACHARAGVSTRRCAVGLFVSAFGAILGALPAGGEILPQGCCEVDCVMLATKAWRASALTQTEDNGSGLLALGVFFALCAGLVFVFGFFTGLCWARRAALSSTVGRNATFEETNMATSTAPLSRTVATQTSRSWTYFAAAAKPRIADVPRGVAGVWPQ